MWSGQCGFCDRQCGGDDDVKNFFPISGVGQFGATTLCRKCEKAIISQGRMAQNEEEEGLPDVEPGKYIHYKDKAGEKPYLVLSCGPNRTHGGREVVYMALYGSREIHTRELQDWLSPVEGKPNTERFKRVR
jgi:hypothetical protein